MKLDIFLQKSSNVFAENRLIKFIVLVIGIATLYNSYQLSNVMNSEKIILVPPVLDSRLEISGSEASDEYIRKFTRYIGALAFTYSHISARGQFAEMLRLFAPAQFPKYKTLFYDLADKVEMAKVTNSYMITKISIDRGKKEIEVTGNNLRFTDALKVESATRIYILNYEIDNGKFWLTELKEKELREI